jgi:hypothetical protein
MEMNGLFQFVQSITWIATEQAKKICGGSCMELIQWLGLNLLIKIGWRNRMGKGSNRRKGDNQKQYAENWEKIFGNKKEKEITAKEFLDNAMRNKKSKDGVWRSIKGWERYDAEQLKKEKTEYE